jgi:hypothetical protein
MGVRMIGSAPDSTFTLMNPNERNFCLAAKWEFRESPKNAWNCFRQTI